MAGFNGKASWTPPGGTTSQTLSFAPCSSGGIPGGCGTAGPPINQCTGQSGCCAVCQSWIEDTGPAAACCGQTAKLSAQSSTSSTSVKITYAGGDLAENTPRQVDVYINCDPTASVLTFQSFVAPSASNPPPPFYLYTLTLSSSSLCSGTLGGLSGGSWFLILLFAGAAIYVIAGVLVNKFKFEKEGIEMVPNIEFWKEVPGYISDGVMWTKEKVMNVVSPQKL